MISLVSLARTAKEKLEIADPVRQPQEIDDYGWGLTINLGPEELKKLQIPGEDLNAGDPVALHGTGIIVTSSVEMVNGQANRNVTIQIQNLALKNITPERSDAELIYGVPRT